MKLVKIERIEEMKKNYFEKYGEEVRPRKCRKCGISYFLLSETEGLKTSLPDDDFNECWDHKLYGVLEMYELHMN